MSENRKEAMLRMERRRNLDPSKNHEYKVHKATPGTDESKEAPEKQSMIERIKEPIPVQKHFQETGPERKKEDMGYGMLKSI